MRRKHSPGHLILLAVFLLPVTGNTAAISGKLARVEFAATPLADVLEFLRAKSIELDPAGAGINFLVDPEVDQEKLVTLRLSDVTIGTAFVCLVDHARLDYRIEEHACLVLPFGKGEMAKKVPRDPGDSAGLSPAVAAQSFQLDRVEFSKAPLRDVIAYLSNRYREQHPEGPGFNIIPSSLIDEEIPVSMKLNDVPASRVLHYVSGTTGVEIRVEPYAVFIDPPGTRALQLARIEADNPNQPSSSSDNRKRGKGYTLGNAPDDPRSPTHPDYIHSAHSDVSKRTNALNNVYKWVNGKWTFVRYGSGDKNSSALDTGSLQTARLGSKD